MKINTRFLVEHVIGLDGIEPVESFAYVWKLRNDRSKMDLLKLLVSEERLFLEYGEDPLDDDIPGEWRSIDKGIWIVPDTVRIRFDVFARWLNCGNWVLYLSSQDVSFRLGSTIEANTVLRKMDSEMVYFCISSYYDNDPWFIYALV